MPVSSSGPTRTEVGLFSVVWGGFMSGRPTPPVLPAPRLVMGRSGALAGNTAHSRVAEEFVRRFSRSSHDGKGRIGELSHKGGTEVSAAVPPQLSAVLKASDDVSRGRAWAAFLEEYSSLLLRVARRAAPGHDGAMDRYAFILDQLRADDCRRLKAFAEGGRGEFAAWLVVVARRLCVDHHRHTHGRFQGSSEPNPARSLEQVTRRNLVDLVADEVDWEQLGDGNGSKPDAELLREERRTALRSVVGGLDVADQLLLTLRFQDDIPMDRIGPMLGLKSRWQVHRRLNAVLARLRSGLEARGFTEP